MFPHPAQALPGSVPAPERVATEVEGDGDGKHRQRPGQGGTVAITLNTVADAATSVRWSGRGAPAGRLTGRGPRSPG
jgi:hypothetical protein